MTPITYKNFETKVENYSGDPFVTFEIEVEKDGKTAILFTRLSNLRKFFCLEHSREYEYIENIRRGIVGYGPKEDKIIAILEQEEFPLEKFVIEYWTAKPGMIESEIERQSMRQTPEQLQNLDDMLDDIEDALSMGSNVSITDLSDELHELIANFCIKKFPEIVNSEPKAITDFNDLLVDHVPDLALAIVNYLDELEYDV